MNANRCQYKHKIYFISASAKLLCAPLNKLLFCTCMWVGFVCCGIAMTFLLTPLCTGSHSITSDPVDPSPGCWFSWGKASGRSLTCPLTFLFGDKVIAISLATTVPEMQARARGMIKVETSCPFITGPNFLCQRAHTSRGLTDWAIVLKTKAIMWWKECSYN